MYVMHNNEPYNYSVVLACVEQYSVYDAAYTMQSWDIILNEPCMQLQVSHSNISTG